MRSLIVAVPLLAACGSSGPTEVTLHAGDTRAAAVQIDGAWQALAARSNATTS